MFRTSTREVFRRPARRYLPIVSPGKNAIWNADLWFRGKVVVLSCIDIWSRRGFSFVCKRKTATSVLEGMKKVVDSFGDNICSVLQIDDGGEFKGALKRYLEDKNVEIRVALGDSLQDKNIKLHQSVVERYNQSARNWTNLYMEEHGLKHFNQQVLDKFNTYYNERKHRTIDCSPNEAYFGKKKPKSRIYKYQIEQLKIEKGDNVRLLQQLPKYMTNRKNKRNYSKRVFKVMDREFNRFKINDNTGKYYPYTRLMLSQDPATETPIPNPRPKNKTVVKTPKRGKSTRQKEDKGAFHVGDRVRIASKVWKGTYDKEFYDGVVIEVRTGDRYQVKLDGYDEPYVLRRKDMKLL